MNRQKSYLLYLLCWVSICLTSLSVLAQTNDIQFNQLTIDDGLSQNSIHSIFQDSQGFLWFGTQDGLNRFDGFEFKTYHTIVGNPNSLSDNYITAIFQDSQNFLWIGTRKGLNRLDITTGNITRYENDEDDSTTLSHNRITSINQDNNKNIWVGTWKGLNQYIPDMNGFKRFMHDSLKPSLPSNYIIDILVDSNSLWLGSKKGLIKFNTEKILFSNYKSQPYDTNSISNNSVKCLIRDRNGMFWVGTYSGLNKFNPTTKKFTRYKHDSKNERSIADNYIHDILEDDNGDIWVATPGGLCLYNIKTNDFSCYSNDATEPRSLSRDNIFSLTQDRSGVIWIGTLGGGINKYHPNQNQFNHFKIPNIKLSNLASNAIWTFAIDLEENLWFGTSNGLFVYNQKQEKIKLFQPNEIKEHGILARGVRDLYLNTKGDLWIASSSNGFSRIESSEIKKLWSEESIYFKHFVKQIITNTTPVGFKVSRFYGDEINNVLWLATSDVGLVKMEFNENNQPKTPTFTKYSHNSKDLNSISHNRVKALEIDKNGVLWVGTQVGLNRFDIQNEKFKVFLPNPGETNKMLGESIGDIYFDKNGVLWVTTYGGGLNKFNLEEETIEHFTVQNGFPNNTLYCVLEDDNGDFWITSNKGLTKFNPITEEIINFDVHHGLQSNEFNANAFYKSKSGKLFFGGVNGFNSFYPDSIKKNKIVPQVSLTELYVMNKRVLTGVSNKELNISDDENVLLDKNFMFLDTLNLSYKHRVFSIDFAALHFQNPLNNQYAYRLLGFENEWVFSSGRNRRATYTNLSPGIYTFEVKASNSDGIWNKEPTSLMIVIPPPFWQTNWFYAICVISLILIISIIFKVRIQRVRLKAEKLRIEDRKEYFKKQNQEKITMLKEIHHRVKNNLQIVNSLLKFQSNEVTDENVKAMFKKSQERVISMARLHEQLYKSEDLKLINVKTHFTTLIEGLIHEYQVGVDIKLDIKVEAVNLGIKTLVPLGLMINELITNSLKYAFKDKKEGVIMVHLKHLEGLKHELIIGDNGIGLKEKSNDTGLGTELVEIFAEQLEGSIERLDKEGTVFRIVFEKIDK